ncbi:calcium/sodium antiporter [Consotaella aegiceratis]|uniref:calcium/sodium antiporter n=1 Tax=Consotaella aegiceratis TaxID=3097961 RepID=UPI002F3EADFB
MTYILIIAGLALLTLGGEMLVRGSVKTAEAFGVSPLLIGLTLVGFGTSTPELVTSLLAAYREAPGIAVGNVIGSNTANILLILGVTALVSPLAVPPAAFKRNMLALGGATLACLAAVLIGDLERWTGVVFVAILAFYVWRSYRAERVDESDQPRQARAPGARRAKLLALMPHLGLTLVGIAATVIGAKLLVDGAIVLAEMFGVSDTVIGLTVVAIGTSLPELVACTIAALRGHGDVALGNVIGSNIYNTLGILGLTAIVHPITVPVEVAHFDIWVLVGATALLIGFLRTRWRLERWESGLLAAAYCCYLAILVTTA